MLDCFTLSRWKWYNSYLNGRAWELSLPENNSIYFPENLWFRQNTRPGHILSIKCSLVFFMKNRDGTDRKQTFHWLCFSTHSQRYLIANRWTANTAGDFVQFQLQWVSQDGKMNPSESVKWEDKVFFPPFLLNNFINKESLQTSLNTYRDAGMIQNVL